MMIDLDLQLYYANITSYKSVDVNKLCSIHHCPARFTSCLKLLFSPGPGLGAPLSSYLEGALYKFHR